ncbi:class I adenylate-forming enzyme family protein [Humibacillus xanthopallidus]|uniref:Acyl-CoA synthetase (AMP-forming)/AMP-acid ligase II n=1 Tax=Humibacillus xanthopallidus TaxID=412689 RepID=A0A543HV56_9MICO|nr:class I adenylate-forming enzyme family protein [Humibacillus xanthopallidus]TQM62247.1 acyl-CoA synthetase (AMP-forming)/AMP-acid ligase II [Humibacillus xanthopallidus]
MTMARGLHPQARVADYQARGWWTDETVDQLFAQQVRTRGEELAVVDPANREALLGSPPRRLTWAELDAEVTHLAAALLDLGLGRGDVIGVQLPNAVELVEVYLAAWSIGVVVSPLPMQYREREVLGMGTQADFAAYVTLARWGDRSPAADVLALRDRLPSLHHVIALGPAAEGGDLAEGVLTIHPASADDTERARLESHVASDPNDANDCLTICWTSGTESEPKGVPRCHLDWLAICWATVDAPRVTADDVLLNPFPMVNMAGINGMFLPWLRTGCVLVQHHPFDLPTFLAQIATERVTYTVAPPALLWMLLHNEPLLAQVDLSSLTRIGSGSVPLQPAMVRGWQEKHGIGIINFFGSNEGVGLLSSPDDFPDPDERAQFFPRYGAPGTTWSSRVSEWIDVRLVDLVTGEDITEPGVPGEMRLNGPTVFAGYLHGERLASPFDERGYLRSGDLFEIAGDRGQFLHYLDRAKDLIIRGGMNIAPAEIEGLIAEHPAVVDVAVIGDPDEVLGERVAAVVSLAPGQSLTLEELVDFMRGQHIASFKLPERLEVRDDLPRNPVGKILKRLLRTPAKESS